MSPFAQQAETRIAISTGQLINQDIDNFFWDNSYIANLPAIQIIGCGI